ncbi:PH domain-containing protein [Patescibacteria group bacterium]|nr:PH domain-containing protein [Patescibacteria group bacterium]
MKQLDPKAVWSFFFGSILRWFFIIIFPSIWGIAILSGLNKRTNNGGDFSFGFFNWLWVVIPIFLVLCFIWAKLTYYFYRYELREDGFRKEHGVVWKKYVTIPYDRIQNIDIYRGIIARFLGISDLQIQTAGGITAGSYGSFSEGRLPGLSREIAEQLRDELIQRARQSKNQGL